MGNPDPPIPLAPTPWHSQPLGELIDRLQTSVNQGLTAEVAAQRLHHYGPNQLVAMPPRSPILLLLDQFRTAPVALLSLAAAISLYTNGLADALVILVVVVVNGLIGYVTEAHSNRLIASLEPPSQPQAWVLRQGRAEAVAVPTVVPGDLLILRPGTSVVADARLVQADGLAVDQAALTGESLPVSKTVTSGVDPQLPLGDRRNMVYRGTLVTGGQGLGVVVATGSTTAMGEIQTLVGQTRPPLTPMEQQLAQVSGQLVWICLAVCGVVFGLGLGRGYPGLEMLKTAIALAVAAVPEGLPAVATTTLALGIQTMAKHQVLIRRLAAVETLGCLQTLCFDKTGTLTTNQMTVVALHTDPDQPPQSAMDWHPGLDLSGPVDRLLQAIVLCNESDMAVPENLATPSSGSPAGSGSATETALLALAEQAGLEVAQVRARFPRMALHHRAADRNWMATLHRCPEGGYSLVVKGNPLEVLDQCPYHWREDRIVPLDSQPRQAIREANQTMAAQGLRVLGVAAGQGPETTAIPLVWLGLVGLADPLRPGVGSVVAQFHQAGITTVMITGDQSATAYAIGESLNLSQGAPLRLVDGGQLEEQGWTALGNRVAIFSRISPAQKLKVVQALQRDGRVVGMTGDGINDTPALRAAQVGIAMGQGGSAAAREVADVVLQDDNLATMVTAIRQGRTIYRNIRQTVHFLLATNLSEIMVMLMGVSLGLGAPLNAMQLLWLNLVTDIFPGLALALEPPAADVLSDPPRDPAEPIIPPAKFWRLSLEAAVLATSALLAYGYGLHQYGQGWRATTLGFMGLTLAQVLHALSCRSPQSVLFRSMPLPANPYLGLALSLALGLQLCSALVPGLHQRLQIAPLNGVDAAVIGVAALLPLFLNELSKGPWRPRSP